MGGATSGTRYGNGAGWGGPAKGAGSGDKRPFTASSPTRVTKSLREARAENGDRMSRYAEEKALDRERARKAKEFLFYMIFEADREDTRVRAAESFLNRVEGYPVTKNANLNMDIEGPPEIILEIVRADKNSDSGQA